MTVDFLPEATASALPPYDVVIPTYNRAHVVLEAVASIQVQSHRAEQIIVVDDGSNDESVAVIKKMSAHDRRIALAPLPVNLGVSNARNVGMVLGAAPWIAFLDSDDLWLPNAAEILLQRASDVSADVVVGHFVRHSIDGESSAPECAWDGSDIRLALLEGGIIGPSWSIVRRETAESVGGFDRSFRNCEDWDFFVRVAEAGAKFVRVDEPVARYRTVHGTRLMHDMDSLKSGAARVLQNASLREISHGLAA